MPIFDQGYQHWNGRLSGHAWRWLAVTRHGVRALLANRFVRLLLLVAWLPALALAGWLALWGMLEQQAESVLNFFQNLLPTAVVASPEDYREAMWTIAYSFFFKAELVVVLFLVLIVGPNLISRDLRFNALPLYLSRPVTRLDYFLGKLGVIAFFLGAVVITPAVAAYLLGVCFSLDLAVVKDTHHILWGSLAYGLVIVLSTGTLMLALSSLSRRSVYVALAWVGLWVISASVSGILAGVQHDTLQRQIAEEEVRRWVAENPPPPGVRLVRGLYPIRNRPPAEERNEEWERWMQGWSQAWAKGRAKFEEEYARTRSRDWRPLASYGNNLDRLGDLFLDTDSAWVTIGRALEAPRAFVGAAGGGSFGGPPRGERFLADRMVYQYPWVWSAGVLAGLMGLSLWILSSRVKSLDRLK